MIQSVPEGAYYFSLLGVVCLSIPSNGNASFQYENLALICKVISSIGVLLDENMFDAVAVMTRIAKYPSRDIFIDLQDMSGNYVWFNRS